VKLAMPNGDEVVNKKVVKHGANNTISAIRAQFLHKTEDEIQVLTAESLISSDPEIDMELSGQFLEEVSQIYINQDQKPVYRINKTEKIYSPKAELKEEREPKYTLSNISGGDVVNWTGKKMPINKVYNKLVFNKKYQIKHINGLTYDFLYEMAKDLNDSKSLMMLGAGKSGKEPLVLNDGGKPYRAFLEGRIQEEKYCLILHLTDQQLKPIPE
jgi:hypothetical protein